MRAMPPYRDSLIMGLAALLLVTFVLPAEAIRLRRITETPRDENWSTWDLGGTSALFSSGESICSNGEWFCGPQNVWEMTFGSTGSALGMKLIIEDVYHPRMSPDGEWVAAMKSNGNDYDIWIWPTGRWEARVQFQSLEGFQERFPNWSNDSRFIAFDSDRPSDLGTTGYQVYYAPVDDPSNIQAAVQVTFLGSNNKHPTWRGDDKEIAYVGDAQENRTISAVDLETGEYRRITDVVHQNRHPDWSPDGRWIVFVTDRWDGIGDIAIIRADGSGDPIRISEGMVGHDDFPEWSRDSQSIMFCGTAIEIPLRPNKEIYIADDLPLDIVPVRERSMGRFKGRFRAKQ